MSPPETLREEPLGPGILRWVIDNPARRNAIAPDVFEWIAERSTTLRGEVVLIRGAGDRVFSAGFDLKALAEQVGSPSTLAPDRPLIAATAAMQDADATFVAVINGAVIGAGVELISACDLRLARHGASLRVPAGRLGVVYHAAGLTRIHAAFGPTVTKRLFLVGDEVAIADARESLCALVELEQLDDEALALAERIAGLAARSVAGNRRLLRALDRARTLPADLLEAHELARSEAYSSLNPPTPVPSPARSPR
ncbi:enoyl-CoA hydratase/isomerase family protein [Nannocystaceae bacterium ST9]